MRALKHFANINYEGAKAVTTQAHEGIETIRFQPH